MNNRQKKHDIEFPYKFNLSKRKKAKELNKRKNHLKFFQFVSIFFSYKVSILPFVVLTFIYIMYFLNILSSLNSIEILFFTIIGIWLFSSIPLFILNLLNYKYGLKEHYKRSFLVKWVSGLINSFLDFIFILLIIICSLLIIDTTPQIYQILVPISLVISFCSNLKGALFEIFHKLVIFLKTRNKSENLSNTEIENKISRVSENNLEMNDFRYYKVITSDGDSQLQAFIAPPLKLIAIYDNALRKLPDGEIISVLLHELGHKKYRFTKFKIIYGFFRISGIFGITIIYLIFTSSITVLHTLNLLFLYYVFIFLLSILFNKKCKDFELKADKFVFDTLPQTEYFVSALKRMADENLHPLEFENKIDEICSDHPSIKSRIKLGEKIKYKNLQD